MLYSPRFSPATILSGVLGIAAFLMPVITLGAQDMRCLEQAIDNRTKELRNVYDAYSEDMNDVVERLGNEERHGVSSGDYHYDRNSTLQAMSLFSYEVHDVWRRLSTNLQVVWDRYYRDRHYCGYTDTPSPSIGTHYNRQQYPNYRRTTSVCPELIRSAPPYGCTYESAQDNNGCLRYILTCRNETSENSCGCTPTYSPVCTRDGRTYDNACMAVCSGRDVWYSGTCNRR